MPAQALSLTQFINRGCKPDFEPSIWIHDNLSRYQVLAIFPSLSPLPEGEGLGVRVYHILTYKPDVGIITTYRVTNPDNCILHIYPVQEELDLR